MKIEIERIWNKYKLSERVREHCIAVNKEATKLAEKLISDGIKVDLDTVDVGSLLHDIGRSKTNGIMHGIIGYKILKTENFNERVCKIALNHIGSGINKQEAKNLGLLPLDYRPETIEQKIVAYVDNLAVSSKITTYDETLKRFIEKFGINSEQVLRLKLMHEELKRYITFEEMKKIDENCGISPEILMENAGRNISNEIKKIFSLNGKKILIFTGTGNNGGDGFVVARYLKKMCNVKIYSIGIPKTNEARKNFEKVKDLVTFLKGNESFNADIIIDALLGTGIKGDLKEPIKTLVRKINESEAFKISIDVPTGISNQRREIINADLIFTLHRFKKILICLKKVGDVRVIDIGINESY